MALDDTAVYIPAAGHVYFAPVGTAKPASLTAPEWPWDEVGHTSRDDGLTITKDGGDVNVLGSWQNANLRSQTEPVVYALTLHLLQVSNTTLAMYFGGGDTSDPDVFGVNINPSPQEYAAFVRIVDGDNEAPLYIPKVSVISDDDVSVDVANFLSFPIRMTVLGVTGSNLMEWYGANLGSHTAEVQTVTITGSPTGGTFTLSFRSQTTAAIAYNASATAVRTALEALSSIGTGRVSVTGGPGPGTPWVVTFDHVEGDLPLMTATSSLTGGTTPAVAVTQTTPGT